MPVLNHFLYQNPLLLWVQKRDFIPKTLSSVPFALKQQQQRREIFQAKKGHEDLFEPLTDKFLQAAIDRSETVGDPEVLSLALSIQAAGSEITYVSMVNHGFRMCDIFKARSASVYSSTTSLKTLLATKNCRKK